LWAESRGWIFYRHSRPPAGVGALAAAELASLVEPEVRHVIELEEEGDLHRVGDETGEGGGRAGA
jgi:hypothetical protein